MGIHIQRLVAVVSVAALAGSLYAATPVPVSAATTTCEYISTNHRVKVSAGNGATIRRDIADRIRVNEVQCGGVATVFNTDSIVVLAGAGTQFVTIYLDQGGFKPGFTDEPGSSDEIEISVSLGGDGDSVQIYGSDGLPDHLVVGKSTGFGVLGKVNLNADETTGIDADLTYIVGVEERIILGRGGQDVISGMGGAGTGDPADFLLKISGGPGSDETTGGSAGDSLIDNQGTDIIKGGPGPDFIDTADGTSGDQVFGGLGNDTCDVDPRDSVSSC